MALKLRKANSVQDGHSRGEEEVYYTMFNRCDGVLNEDGSKTIRIGWNYLGAACSPKMDAANAKTNCLAIQKKLAVEKIGEHNSIRRLGTIYKVYSYQQVLERRRAAGMTHFTNNRGRVELVNPNCVAFGDTCGQSAPGGNLPTVGNLPIAPVGSLPIAPCGQSAHPYKKEESKEGNAGAGVPVSSEPVSEIPLSTQDVAASIEPSTGNSINEPAAAKTPQEESAPPTSKTPSVDMGLVVVTNTSEDHAPGSAYATPAIKGEPTVSSTLLVGTAVPMETDREATPKVAVPEVQKAPSVAVEIAPEDYAYGDPSLDDTAPATPFPYDDAPAVSNDDISDNPFIGGGREPDAQIAPHPAATLGEPETQALAPVMPAECVTVAQKVAWLIEHGQDRPGLIADAIGRAPVEVAQAIRTMLAQRKLTERTERGMTRYDVVEGKAA